MTSSAGLRTSSSIKAPTTIADAGSRAVGTAILVLARRGRRRLPPPHSSKPGGIVVVGLEGDQGPTITSSTLSSSTKGLPPSWSTFRRRFTW